MKNIQEKIFDYINNNRAGFTLSKAQSELIPKTQLSKKLIENYLEESQNLFISEDNKTKEKKYTTRKSFFNNAEFLISPSSLELQKGILFSGHRFIPFYSEELFPTESFEITTEENEIIPVKNITFKLEDLYDYYSMLGAEGIIDNLTADNTENIGIIGNPGQKIKVSVFDFNNFYKKHSLNTKSYLKFTVKDWSTGKFTVSFTKKSQDNEELKYKWSETFEEGLIKTFEESGPYLEIPEQLALGFFNSNNSILKNPPCSIDEFIKNNEKIQIKFYDNNTILWYKEELNSISENNETPISISQGTIESLDAILEELGLIISSTEIESFIKDSLLSGNDTPTSILHKIFPESGITFKDKAQETAFYNHFEELWEGIITEQKTEQSADTNTASFRREILDNLENLYTQYYESGINSESLKNQTPEQNTLLKDIHSIREILSLLNSNKKDLDSDEVEKLDEIIFNRLKKLNESLEEYLASDQD